jgi:lysophospholipase L1-like esterase
MTVAAFGFLELALRGWVFFFREQAERFDIAAGTFVLIPGRYTGPGGRPYYVNARGFVGSEFEDPAPPGTVRMVALGDSCTFGGGTGPETYTGQLEQLLQDVVAPGRVQVINAGIRGLSSELGLRRLVTKVLPLSPDVVMIYLGWNDLMKLDPTGHGERPGIAVVARGLDRLWLTKALRKLLFYYLRPVVHAPATGPSSRTGAFRDYKPVVFTENLRQIVTATRQQGASVVLMTLPSVVSEDMGPEELTRFNVIFPYYSSAYGVADFVDLIAAYNRAIREVAMKEGVILVDLASEMDGRSDRRSLFFDTMHPSQEGRVVIAEILARRVPEVARLAGSGRRAAGRSELKGNRSTAGLLQPALQVAAQE